MSKNIKFMKLSGSGNDFIFIENFENQFKEKSMPDFVKSVCRRGLAVGADGLMFIQSSDKADFKWRFFNSDGSEGEMCGNGGRCAIRFAKEIGLISEEGSFETIAGVLDASIDGNRVKVRMTKPHSFTQTTKIVLGDQEVLLDSINTGVPHAILYTKDLDSVDVLNDGREIRNHTVYKPDGTNVNYYKILNKNKIEVKTYEKGVESIMSSCGSGSFACAYDFSKKNNYLGIIKVINDGGVFQFSFSENYNENFLIGKAEIEYEKEIEIN